MTNTCELNIQSDYGIVMSFTFTPVFIVRQGGRLIEPPPWLIGSETGPLRSAAGFAQTREEEHHAI
jgi:hypothetical protein